MRERGREGGSEGVRGEGGREGGRERECISAGESRGFPSHSIRTLYLMQPLHPRHTHASIIVWNGI